MDKTILIIDDDTLLRDSLANGLRKEDFSVITAQSAEQGFEILKKVSVDAIVLDRMMTGMDGLSFLKKIRSKANTTPVIMLTAMSGPENGLSGEEKRLLFNLVTPVGNIVQSPPMVAKRLRNKLNGVLSDIDIVTVRGQGYKLIQIKEN